MVKLCPILLLGLLSTCIKPAPIAAPVVAPAGPATVAVAPAVAEAGKAQAAINSKISAAAGVILDLNATQAAGPATAGIEGEASGIKQLAGEPTAEDQAAALKRKATDLAGDLAKITGQYQHEHDANVSLRTRAELAEKTRDDAIAAAKLEQESQRVKFQAEIDRITAAANARVASAALEAKAEQDAKINFWLQIGSFGLGVVFCIGAVAAGQFAVAAPFLGPNIIRCLWAIGGGLIALGLLIRSVDRFIDAHPYLFYGLLIGMAVALVAAAILAWSNHHHAAGDSRGPLLPRPEPARAPDPS